MLPTALAGIVTGVMLAVARVIGETAPLLVAAGFTQSLNNNPLDGPMMTLPVFVYRSYVDQGNPASAYLDRAWAGALTLILIVMLLNLAGRLDRRQVRPQDRPLSANERTRLCPNASRSRTSTSSTATSRPSTTSTLTVEPRTVTAFIGPSGCGKSTLLRTLNRMHEVIPKAYVEGQVLLDGDDLYGPGVDPVRVRRQVGMVFQRPNPFPTMSIGDNVLAGVKLNNQRMSATKAKELLESSLRGANLWNEVKDRLDKPGSGLSGGQQQRLCIARAIAVQPEVILMDEPCSALDPISTLAIEDLIGELKESYTVVIVTHNMQQAARVSDQTAFFNLAAQGKPGKLIEIGPTDKIFSNPDEKATEDYISGRFG